MLKIDRGLNFLKDNHFSLGNVNFAKIYERFLSKNTLRDKRRDSFDLHRVNLLFDDSICMVKLLVILLKTVFFLLHG